MHTCADLVASVPFLEDAEDDFVRFLVTQLHPTVSNCTNLCSLGVLLCSFLKIAARVVNSRG